jgi:hypothetical protein
LLRVIRCRGDLAAARLHIFRFLELLLRLCHRAFGKDPACKDGLAGMYAKFVAERLGPLGCTHAGGMPDPREWTFHGRAMRSASGYYAFGLIWFRTIYFD